MREMTRSILRGWFQSELSCRPGCWRCHDGCIPSGRPCWLSWLKVSEGNGKQPNYTGLFHPAFCRLCHCRGFWLNGSFETVCLKSHLFYRNDAKQKFFWLFQQIYPFSCPKQMEVDAQLCDQRWKETSDHCTVAWICDGFYCEGMSLHYFGSATESFSSQLSPSGVQIPGTYSCVWQKVLMASRHRRKSLQ